MRVHVRAWCMAEEWCLQRLLFASFSVLEKMRFSEHVTKVPGTFSSPCSSPSTFPHTNRHQAGRRACLQWCCIREGSLLCVAGFCVSAHWGELHLKGELFFMAVCCCSVKTFTKWLRESTTKIAVRVPASSVCDLWPSLWSLIFTSTLYTAFTAFSLTLGLVGLIFQKERKQKESSILYWNVGKGRITPKQSRSSYGRTSSSNCSILITSVKNWTYRNKWWVSADLSSVSFVHVLNHWNLFTDSFFCWELVWGNGFLVGKSASVRSWCWRCHHSGRNRVNLMWAGGERGGGKFWSATGLSLVTCRFRAWQLRCGEVLSVWPHFLVSSAWESGLCLAEGLIRMLFWVSSWRSSLPTLKLQLRLQVPDFIWSRNGLSWVAASAPTTL